MFEYLTKYSENYKDVLDINEIGRGGEAIVYSVIHGGSDEIVIKCPINRTDDDESYEAIMSESMLLKHLDKPKYVCKVKEEIIEFNEVTN